MCAEARGVALSWFLSDLLPAPFLIVLRAAPLRTPGAPAGLSGCWRDSLGPQRPESGTLRRLRAAAVVLVVANTSGEFRSIYFLSENVFLTMTQWDILGHVKKYIGSYWSADFADFFKKIYINLVKRESCN